MGMPSTPTGSASNQSWTPQMKFEKDYSNLLMCLREVEQDSLIGECLEKV
jgi:hypothetical protein